MGQSSKAVFTVTGYTYTPSDPTQLHDPAGTAAGHPSYVAMTKSNHNRARGTRALRWSSSRSSPLSSS